MNCAPRAPGTIRSAVAGAPPLGRRARSATRRYGPNSLFKGTFTDKAKACETYDRWLEEVKASVPEEKLLVFDVKEGYAPLCKFLGKPVPNEPFPHLNSTPFFRWVLQLLSCLTCRLCRRKDTKDKSR